MLGRCSSPTRHLRREPSYARLSYLGPAIPVGPSFIERWQSEARRRRGFPRASDDALGFCEAKREHHSTARILFRGDAAVMRPHDLGYDCKTKSGAG